MPFSQLAPRFYPRPQPVQVKISEFVESSFLEEAAVRIQIGTAAIEATIPSYALLPDKKTIKAAKVGEIDDDYLVALPPSSISHPPIRVPKNLASGLLVLSEVHATQ